jgi:hypothetical protein
MAAAAAGAGSSAKSLADVVRKSPFCVRHRFNDARLQPSRPRGAAVSSARVLAERVYSLLARAFTETKRLGLGQAAIDLYELCQTTRVTLRALEELAVGTSFHAALAAARALHPLAFESAASVPRATKPEVAVAKSAAATMTCVIQTDDDPRFAGPYWTVIPAFHLWLAVAGRTSISEELLGLYMMYFDLYCAPRLHPGTVQQAKRVLLACVQQYTAVLPELATAIRTWRGRSVSSAPNRRDALASPVPAFWDTVNRCCFVTGQTTPVFVYTGIGQDMIETFLLPQLAEAEAVMTVTGTRRFRVTRDQVGSIGFRTLHYLDKTAVCWALEPEALCMRILAQPFANVQLAQAACAFTEAAGIHKWLGVCRKLHAARDPSIRLYPA